MRLTLFLIFCCCLTISACQQQGPSPSPSNAVVDDDSTHHTFGIKANDPEMNAAIQKAHDLFPRFDSAFSKGKINKEASVIKVKYIDDDQVEYMWVGDLYKVQGQYWGVLLDSPIVVKGLKRGDTVVIQDKDIADWIYEVDTTHYGGYTQRVIMKRLTPEQRARLDSDAIRKFAD